MSYEIELLMTTPVTRDTRRLVYTRPEGFEFKPGQGVELSIDEEGWRDQGRPFTPTSLAEDRLLEFTVKGYPDHEGVTARLHTLRPGARFRISEPFGTIQYRGPGIFLAGGAGITPFIAILRQLAQSGKLEGHRLIFSNKTQADIIYEQELTAYLGGRATFICTAERHPGYAWRHIDKQVLQEQIRDFDQCFYVCGPPGFMDAVNGGLKELGADPQTLIFEN